MSANKKLLKTFLTTASVTAVILSYAEITFAQARRSIGTASVLSTGAKMDKNGAAPAANVPFATNSTFKFNNDNVTITANIAGISIAAIDTVNKAAPILNITEDTLLGSVVGTTKLATIIQAGKELKLTGTGADGTLIAPIDPAGTRLNAFIAAENTLTAFGDIDFVGARAKLIIDNSGLVGANAGKNITLEGAFLRGNNGILEVLTDLTATNETVATIDEINIGAVGSAATLTIDGSAYVAGGAATIDLLPNAPSKIVMANADSVLKLTNDGANPLTFNLKKDFDPSGAGAGAGARGILELNANTGAGGLILQGDVGGEKIGIAGDEWKEILVTGDKSVTIKGGAHAVDLTNVKKLTVLGQLIAQTATVGVIDEINIGSNDGVVDPLTNIVGTQVPGKLTIDATEGDVDILDAGHNINFKAKDSILQLAHSDAGNDRVITLKRNLIPTVGIQNGDDEVGIVQIISSGAGKKLIIAEDGGGEKLGLDTTHRLAKIIIDGAEETSIEVPVFAKRIEIAGAGIVGFTDVMDLGAGSKFKFTANNLNVYFDEDAKFTTLDFNDHDGAVIVAAGKKLTTILTDSTGNDKGKVVFEGTGELEGTNVAVANGIDKVTINAATADTFKIAGKHSIKRLVVTNDPILRFRVGAELVGGINNAAGGAVKIEFKGNNTVTGDIGGVGHLVGDITLTGANKFGGDVYTSRVLANTATFEAINDLTIFGRLEGRDTTIKLTENTLKIEDTDLSGAVVFEVATQAAGADIGHIEVEAGKTLDLVHAASIAIKMNTATLADVAGKNYVLLRGPGAINPAVGIAVPEFADSRTPAIVWIYDSATYTLRAKDNARAIVATALASDPQKNEITEAILDNRQVAEQLSRLSSDELRLEAINDELPIVTTGENIAAINSAVTEVISAAVGANVMTISSRIGDIANPVSNPSIGSDINSGVPSNSNSGRKLQQSEAYGVAAGGDAGVKMGVWASPFYSSSIQKLRQQTPGYKANSVGGTIGFDGMVNDSSILGAAFTYVDTDIKHRNEKAGDKTKAKTYIGSLYGVHSFVDGIFAQGILSFSHNIIKNNEYRSLTKETALAKYKSNSYGGEITVGKNINFTSEVALTPMIGARYTKYYDKGYTETNASYNNLTVKKKSIEKGEGILGLRVSGMSNVNETVLLPEVHGFVNHDFIAKKPDVDARFVGKSVRLPTRAIKPVKTSYSLGASLTGKYDIVECGLGYDAHLAKKYIGHQGSFKVRVNL